MNIYHRFPLHRPAGLPLLMLLGALLLLLTACGQQGAEAALSTIPTPHASPTTPSVAAQTATPLPANWEIVVWTPPELTDRGEDEAAEILTQQLAAFEAGNPSISVRYEPKALDGPAAILPFLRSASSVAPRAVPDIVILPSTDFNEAARAGFLYPLDPLLSPELGALYPLAGRDGKLGEHILGIPYLVTVEHIAYRPRPEEQPPIDWAELLDGPEQFLFAAGGRADGVDNPFLLQLLNVADISLGEGEVPDLPALQRVLEFYNVGRERSIIPTEVISHSDPARLWDSYLAGSTELLETDARTFMDRHLDAPGLSYTAVPTSNGLPTTIAEGYVLGITTPDPVRQAAAARYIAWLLAPEQFGPYAAATGWLPTHPAALSTAVADPAYREFLDSILAHAVLRPSGPQWIAISKAMQEQLLSVLRGKRTPEEAVGELQQTIRP